MSKLNSRSIKSSKLYIVIVICSLVTGFASVAIAERPDYEAYPGVANGHNVPDIHEIQAFTISKYTYCDATLLADYWGQSIYAAKARIGRKVIWQSGGIPFLEQMLVDARLKALTTEGTRCGYQDNGYTYDNAVALAEFWGDPSPWKAKQRIEHNLMLGNQDVVDAALNQIRQP